MTIKNRKASNKKEKIKKVFKRAMLIVTYIPVSYTHLDVYKRQA